MPPNANYYHPMLVIRKIVMAYCCPNVVNIKLNWKVQCVNSSVQSMDNKILN